MAVLAARSEKAVTPITRSLLIALLVLSALITLLVGGLFMLRRARRSRQQSTLPSYTDKSSRRSSLFSVGSSSSKHDSLHDPEKTSLIEDEKPASLVPEIRITFPDDVDEKGRERKGRQVVVKIGESCVGLEPVRDVREKAGMSEGEFHSLDLERIGGLKEMR